VGNKDVFGGDHLETFGTLGDFKREYEIIWLTVTV